MRITRIDIEGGLGNGNYATAIRKRGAEFIEVTILTPAMPNGRTHHVQADCHHDLWSMAQCLQETLDEARHVGAVHDYYEALRRLAD